MGAPVYATREQYKTALDSVETARNNRRIDRNLRGASRDVERLTLRTFYPSLETRYFDWLPEGDTPRPWRLWLEDNELAAAPTSVTVAGTLLDPADYLCRPSSGPPFDHIEINLSGNASWSSGDTWQNAIAILGPYASCPIEEITGPDLAANIADTTTRSCDVTATADIGIGSLIRVGTERMNVVGRSMITTAQTLLVPMTDQLSSTSVRVTTGTAFVEDEVILLDSEKMRIDEITGNTLIVKRAWDGTVLASHNGATIYAARRLTVERGACGTTAATHTAGDDVLVYQPPALITEYVLAQALVTGQQESAAYGRMVGSGDNAREAAGRALMDLRDRVKRTYYRVRSAAV
jgi:hypothetical protein